MSLNIPVNIIFIFLLLVIFIERLIECFLDIKDLFIKPKITDLDKINEKSRRILTTCCCCLLGIIICIIIGIDIFDLAGFRTGTDFNRNSAYFITGLLFGTSSQIIHIFINTFFYFIKKMKKELSR